MHVVFRWAFLLIAISGVFAFSLYDYTCIDLPVTSFNYGNIPFPSDVINHPEIDNMLPSNPTTDAGATLGRVLFYDSDLSQNHTVACASCHQQQFAFTDSARFSVGFDGRRGDRNSMSLMHVRFQKDTNFFWDGRASSVEAQVLMPFQNPVEMGMTLQEVVNRVAAKPYYPPLFQAAFGSPVVTSKNIARALSQFVRSINTFDSKYRKGVEMTQGNPSTTPFANFTAQENLGKDLFMDITRGNCQACHTKNLMVPEGGQNIGLDSVYVDNGFGALTGNPNSNQNGKFKVPSLINVAVTAPFMHDGRFKTLEEVVDFYSDSIKPHPNLSGFLREILPGNPSPNNNPCMTCPPRKPHFTPAEKQALVAFLHTLTDSTALTDPRWSNPFCLSATGINELKPVLSLSVYPSPLHANSTLRIETINGKAFEGKVVIQSTNGQVVFQKNTVFINGKNAISIDSALSAGIYVLAIFTQANQLVERRKIIVQQ